jgi:hypothetical protein
VIITQIPETACPHCKSAVSSENKARQHTNGYWNEVRLFDCGHEIRFSPNFMQCETTKICPKHPAEKEKKAKRQVALDRLRSVIKKQECDEDFKKHLLSQFAYVHP